MRRRGKDLVPVAGDEPAAWEVEMEQRLQQAEAKAGVCLTPEWRRFFVALAAPLESPADEPSKE